MPATDEEVLADWAEILAEDTVTSVLEPGELTAEMYAQLTHRTHENANKALKRRFDKGELTRRRIGKQQWAYRPVQRGSR